MFGRKARFERRMARLEARQIENQRKLIELTQTQGPQLLAAITAAVDGGIAGKVGLKSNPKFPKPGDDARY